MRSRHIGPKYKGSARPHTFCTHQVGVVVDDLVPLLKHRRLEPVSPGGNLKIEEGGRGAGNQSLCETFDHSFVDMDPISTPHLVSKGPELGSEPGICQEACGHDEEIEQALVSLGSDDPDLFERRGGGGGALMARGSIRF